MQIYILLSFAELRLFAHPLWRNGLAFTIDLVRAKLNTPATTESVDDYLKAIMELGGAEEQRVTSNALAGHLDVRAASVTGMLQKLASQRPSFVKYEKRHGVVLTEMGRRRASEILRHHRLLERFLHDVLDFSWDEVHDEAERLEHYISERLEDRIAAKLGDPDVDPHGHVIPEKDGVVAIREEIALSKWPCGVRAVISSVSDRDSTALREMKRLGLVPGTGLVVSPGTRNASLLVRIGGKPPSRLSHELAAGILVVRESSSDKTMPVLADRVAVAEGMLDETKLDTPRRVRR